MVSQENAKNAIEQISTILGRTLNSILEQRHPIIRYISSSSVADFTFSFDLSDTNLIASSIIHNLLIYVSS
jgi:hypothetical protein